MHRNVKTVVCRLESNAFLLMFIYLTVLLESPKMGNTTLRFRC